MSADLFGSFAESTCAALVISSTTLWALPTNPGVCPFHIANLMYPLNLMAFGIILCIIISVFATHVMKVETLDKIESTLKVQLVGSTIALLGVIYLVAYVSFPAKF
jgi:Na+/H+-translocating membrane pyrophosphatase